MDGRSGDPVVALLNCFRRAALRSSIGSCLARFFWPWLGGRARSVSSRVVGKMNLQLGGRYARPSAVRRGRARFARLPRVRPDDRSMLATDPPGPRWHRGTLVTDCTGIARRLVDGSWWRGGFGNSCLDLLWESAAFSPAHGFRFHECTFRELTFTRTVNASSKIFDSVRNPLLFVRTIIRWLPSLIICLLYHG